MLYYPVYNTDFYDEAKKYDAEFSDEALDILYDYLNDNEEEYIEMDMVRIKNEWTEYDSWKEAAKSLIDITKNNIKNYKDYVENSGYTCLECDDGHILIKDGIW